MADRLTTAHINLAHYKHNLAQIREQVGDDVRIMAVVKANAYGHGMERMAQAAIEAGVEHIGVVSVGELKRIRQVGISTPVLLLNYVDADSLSEVVQHQGSITVMDEAIIDAAQAVALAANTQLKMHMKIDTGMHRAGCDPDRAVDLARRIQASSNIELEGVFTHFAEADDPDSQFTIQQLRVFRDCLDALRSADIHPELVHAANSAATVTLPDARFSMVRPGVVTYGLNPLSPAHSQYEHVAQHFKPVLSLISRVVHIRSIQPGEAVGYNLRWTAGRLSTLALIPIGYGDGWRRSPHATQVLIHGAYAPIVGNISMDQTVVDITDIPDVAVGDTVTLLGAQASHTITADDIAAEYQTINYEVVTSLADRIVRVYED